MPLSTANSFAMWTLGWDARNRAVEGKWTNPEAFTGDAIAAIIQAAASAEGFINELADAIQVEEGVNAELSRQGQSQRYPVLQQLSAFARQHTAIEAGNGRTTDKFVAAFETLSGQPFNRGSRLYQDFADLMKLRDSLMHIRMRDQEGPVESQDVQEPTLTIQPPEGRIKFIKRLMKKGLTWQTRENSETGASWFDLIQTARMADWACRSALNIVLAILDLIPDSLTDTSRIYKDGFRTTANRWIQDSQALT